MFVLSLAGATSLLGAGCEGSKVPPPSTSMDGGPGDAPHGEGGGAPGADGGVALDNFLGQVAKAVCAWQFRCCSLPEIDLIGESSYLTETECVSQSILQLGAVLAVERAAVLEGRLTVDAGKLDACVQQLTARGCTSAEDFGPPIGIAPLLGECADPFVGQVPMGARCTNLRECVPGSVCSHFDGDYGSVGLHRIDGRRLSASPPLGTSVFAQGICVADQREGQPCASTAQCQVGLYCRRTDFVCARPAGQGEPCVSVDPSFDGAHGPPIVCGTGAAPLVCVADVCRRLPRESEPCLSTGDAIDPVVLPRCDPTPALDLVCVGQELGGAGICKKTAGLGAVCGGSGIPPCAASLQCDVPESADLGTCKEAPGEGKACPGLRCRAPAVCYTGNSLECVVPPAARYGTKCESDLDCASLFCMPTTTSISEDSKRCTHTMVQVLCAGAGNSAAISNTPPPLPPLPP